MAVVRKNQPNALDSGRAGGLGHYQTLGDMEVSLQQMLDELSCRQQVPCFRFLYRRRAEKASLKEIHFKAVDLSDE